MFNIVNIEKMNCGEEIDNVIIMITRKCIIMIWYDNRGRVEYIIIVWYDDEKGGDVNITFVGL